jgi:hypothetical protein
MVSNLSNVSLVNCGRLINLSKPDCQIITGFKYIGNTALDLVKEGFEVPFGYEEAIGFMFGSEVRDKDGVAATVCLTYIPSTTTGWVILVGPFCGARGVAAPARQNCQVISAGIISAVR